MTLTYCPACLEKQREIDDLKDEVRRLKDLVRRQERTAAEGPFGSSTPSSKVPFKPEALPDRQARVGGATAGHPGRGRVALAPDEADRVERLSAPSHCPGCGEALHTHQWRSRTVLDLPPVAVQRVVYVLEVKRCPRCGRTVQARPPGVLPKALFGNGLLAHVLMQHYRYGAPMGTVARQLGLHAGSLLRAMHQVAGRLAAVIPRLQAAYRRAPVRHADETGWRRDGSGGYAWLFNTTTLSLFRLRPTRAASVVRETLGKRRLSGVLVVDRYGGYNRAPCRIQYCYAHLLRDVQDLEKKFPNDAEVRRFVATLAPLLADAIRLRSRVRNRRKFRRQAGRLRRRIEAVVNAPARHPAVQTLQDLFREKADRLYHWTRDPAIPADNNHAERDLRPLVIARKVSFGSQSEKGARTREILLSVVHTLAKRTADPHGRLMACLDTLASNPSVHPFPLLFGKPRQPNRN